MAKEILINAEPQEKRVAIVRDGTMDEFYIERPQDKTIVGNIYKGTIEAVMPSIGAAFVDIGLPKKGFLYLSEIDSAYEPSDIAKKQQKEVHKGQEVLVQVVKESFGQKGPRISCQIGIAGRYLVLMPLENQTGVSRRIEDEAERKRLRQIMAELDIPKEVGFIVRTAACGKTKQELSRDAHFLHKLWKRIEREIAQKKAPSLIYEEYDLSLRVIRDSFTDDIDKLLVDSKPEYYRIIRFMRTFLSYLARKVELYRGDDLFGDRNVERQIAKIFESKVYLKSKAYIVIEPTEGLVVIDVNSGGFTKRHNQEDTAFKVNCEAAIEVAHQLRLRDLGGIIVIDFIDMQKDGHRREVLNCLKRSLANDKAKYDILGISKFGVVEMTRERVHNTVHTLSFQMCPYCQGRGKVKSPTTMAIYSLKEVRKFLKGKTPKQVNVTLNPVVIEELLKNKNAVVSVERRFKTQINLVSNPAFRIEEVSIA